MGVRGIDDLITTVINSEEKRDLQQFLYQLRQQEQKYWLRNQILTAFANYCTYLHKPTDFAQFSTVAKLLNHTQEIIVDQTSFCLVVRVKIAEQQALRLTDDLFWEIISTQELLDWRDRLVNRYHPEQGDLLELDFLPFYDYSPLIRDPKNIGKGVQFLNRYLSSQLFQAQEADRQWLESIFDFLRLHNYQGVQLLINQRIDNYKHLSAQVKAALVLLEGYPKSAPYNQIRFALQELGFEPGWGNTAARIQESLELLDGLMDAPDYQSLEVFLSRIPMLFRLVLVSVHGWFAQEGVLGRPDTGGQVVYVLDQARSLEKQLQADMILAGLEKELAIEPKVIILTRLIPHSEGTNCNQRLEKVYGTQNVWILRVPLREFNPNVTENWLSRFEIWPYLETFALDAEKELLAELQGRPDLIIGNYSDGNLVAFLLARKLKVTQCNIAHALEKSKYLFSNLYWQELEEQYHFSLQFTADLIAMNAANFIISSSYQEIAGTPDSIGQYESYQCFTMPDLYHVVSGIELFSPKFNVVPPGVNENYFFPYTQTQDRLLTERERLEAFLFTEENNERIFGYLEQPEKRPIFSLARLDRIKNLTGLAECFGEHPELQEQCNLILVAGKLRPEESTDSEEIEQIHQLYQIIEKHQLKGKIRWLGVMLPKADTGEIYRIIADRGGIFVQPALFEAFGLTVLEAMFSGLPTFATEFGGPREIIQDQVNGFLINPTHRPEMAAIILNFLSLCQEKPNYWQEISQNAIARIASQYTWKIHTQRLLSLARIYGFWNHTSQENREELLRYIETIFYLIFKPRAQSLLEQHQHR